jgi:hypothetical protein
MPVILWVLLDYYYCKGDVSTFPTKANRTHAEEFYEVVDITFELADTRPKLLEWEEICNTNRPNQANNYLTQAEKLKQFHIICK